MDVSNFVCINIIKMTISKSTIQFNRTKNFVRLLRLRCKQFNFIKNFCKLFNSNILYLTEKASCNIIRGMTAMMYCLKETLNFGGILRTSACKNHIGMTHEETSHKGDRRCLFRKETKFCSLNTNTNYLWIIKNIFVYHLVVIRT